MAVLWRSGQFYRGWLGRSLRATAHNRRSCGHRLHVEALEDRTLLSVGPASPEPLPVDLLSAPAVDSGPREQPSGPGELDPDAPQTIGTSFRAITLEDQVQQFGSGSFPPDTMGAVGPNHFVEVINSSVAIYDTTGTRLSHVGLTSFFTGDGVTPANGTFDTRVLYDRESGRWFATAMERGTVSGRDNDVILAVSDTSDPTGDWDRYRLDVGVPQDATYYYFTDYATLGVDSNGVYFGMRIFQSRISDNFTVSSYAKIAATSKAPLIAATPSLGTLYSWSNITNMYSTPQPAYNFDAVGPSGRAWFVSSSSSVYANVNYRTLTWSGGVPTLSSTSVLTTPAFAAVLNAPALGSTTNINTGDMRLQMAVIRDNRLWTARTVGLNSSGGSSGADRTGVEWLELNVADATATLVQSGRVYDSAASPRYYYYPSVMVSGQGHMAISFSGSKSTEYVGAYTTGRLATDPLGTTQAVSLIKAGEDSYQRLDSSSRNRWGDYSYTSLDPNDDMTMWTIQEYAFDSAIYSDTWGTWVAQLRAPAPTLTSPSASAYAGLTGVSLGLSGTGLYDPGTGLPNHLAVQLSGGATNGISGYSVTYTNSTSATVTFDISPTASGGYRDIALTNPDGQSVTVTNGFEVLIDTTAPTATGVPNDGPGADIDYQTSTTSLSASWAGVFADAQTGVTGYEWAIGTISGGTNVQGYTSVGTSTSAINSSLSLSSGTTYYVTVRATNGALLQTTATSDGVLVDNTPPTVVISRQTPAGSPTNADSVTFLVDFNEDVQNVNEADFELALGGTVTTGALSVGDGGDSDASTYTVTAPTVAGDGSLDLNFAAGQNIQDSATNAFDPSTGITSEQTYMMDNTPPTAAATATDITAGGDSTKTITVQYDDGVAVSVSTIASGDIQVTGPNGYSQTGTLVPGSVTPAVDGSPITAQYTIPSPASGSRWDWTDNGTYTVSMVASQVSDTSGNWAAAGTIGTFAVNVFDTFEGTADADTFRFEPQASGQLQVTINTASPVLFDAPATPTIHLYGLGGSDRVNLYDTTGNDTLTAGPTGSQWQLSTGVTVESDGFEKLYAFASAGGANDRAYLHDSSGNDTFTAHPVYSYSMGTGFYNYAWGFDKVYADASAGGADDKAYLYDSSGNDTFTAGPDSAEMSVTGFYYSASTFDKVYAYATAGGTDDQAYLHDSSGNDTFKAFPAFSYLTGTGFYNYASGFDKVYGDALAGGAADMAYLYDSSGNDTFTAGPDSAEMSGTGFFNSASTFDKVYGLAIAGGADDRAYLHDSSGNDTFAGCPTYSYLTGTGFYNYVSGFDRVYADALAGGAADKAYLYDSLGNDTFTAEPTLAEMSGTGFYYSASTFDKVQAHATAGGADDRAYLHDSSGNDTFAARPAYSYLTGTGFYNYAWGFDKVYADAAAGGAADMAYLYDSSGNDTFTAGPDSATMSGTGFYYSASTFDKVYGYSTAGGADDQAYLHDSSGNDTFKAFPAFSYLTGTGFYNYASGFDKVYGDALAGGADDKAYLYDSSGNDILTAGPTLAEMSGTGFFNSASTFDKVYALATAGGADDRAYLHDSSGNDTFAGCPTYSYLTGSGFYNYVSGFDWVYADGSGGGTDDKAYLYDSSGSDTFWVKAVDAVMSNGSLNDTDGSLLTPGTYYNRVSSFERVSAYGTAGGTNTRDINSPVDLALLNFYGSWVGDDWP